MRSIILDMRGWLIGDWLVIWELVLAYSRFLWNWREFCPYFYHHVFTFTDIVNLSHLSHVTWLRWERLTMSVNVNTWW